MKTAGAYYLPESDNDEDDDEGDMDDDKASTIISKAGVRKALEHQHADNDEMLFGGRLPGIQLSILHPDPHLVLKLWQIYLNNVDPLLKVTHAPSLQARIIDTMGNFSAAEPTLHALMFGVYCMAVQSLSQNDCESVLGSAKDAMLKSYHFACQQALLECRVTATDDRDCLTAFYLYLVSKCSSVGKASMTLTLCARGLSIPAR